MLFTFQTLIWYASKKSPVGLAKTEELILSGMKWGLHTFLLTILISHSWCTSSLITPFKTSRIEKNMNTYVQKARETIIRWYILKKIVPFKIIRKAPSNWGCMMWWKNSMNLNQLSNKYQLRRANYFLVNLSSGK